MTDARLRRLISLWLDDAVTPRDFHALTEALRTSADARRTYLDAMGVNAELHNTAAAKRYLEEIMDDAATAAKPAGPGPTRAVGLRPASERWPLFALAATILVAVGALLGGVLSQDDAAPTADEAAPAALEAIITSVEPQSADCRWYVEQADRRQAEALRGGDVIRVTQGKLALRYRHGTNVELVAPAAYQLVTSMKSRMLLGRLTAEVTEQGKGFSVITPRATVVDFGTSFSVSVEDNGATDVVVHRGEVDVDYRADGETSARAQRLQMGEAMRLDAAGTASRIVSITSRPAGARGDVGPLLITEVRDNIDRMSSLNYYEIVQGGMAEDALAFVDREAHQWNGVDADGMPPYLVGGDYVKMFNNDKFNHDIRIGVRLAAPAQLYVLMDDRLEPPTWLREGFADTGDKIGMDVGPFFSKGAWHNRTPPGVGPGESVEDTFSVWVKEIEEPGLVFLGSTEAPESEPNMYGIVAVPLTTRGSAVR